jgi:PAS domain S-box-containing protein
VQDVTDLRQAEAEARRGEAVLESVFQSLPDLFFLMDTDGTIRDYRARTDGDLYLPPENFLGRRMQDVVPPTVGSLFEHHLAALGPNGDLASYEYDLAMPGGERRFEARLTRLPDSTQVIAIVRDVTARKHAEDALRETQQRFLEALENIPDVVVIYDRMLRIRYVNAATRNLTGRPVESFIGRGDEEIWPSPICETWLPTLRTARNTATIQTIEVDLDLPGTPPAGGPRCLAITCVPLLNEQGEVREVLGITHDLSRRKAAEQAIRRLNEALEERVRARTAELETANKELETFTYSVSHDLKAPLRGIDGYSRLLLDDHLHCLNDEGRLFLNNVRRGVAQMHDLINDLLAYSRMERRTLQPTVIDLEAQVQAVLTERAEEIAARDVEVLLDLNGLKVHADPDGLAMILRNLMDNALKFGRDRQPLRIGIHATAADDRVILRFEDNGIGFDSRFQERIFDIFQRLQRAEDYPGTGIGLAIVRKAAQRMGGRVWAEGTAGLGATFFVELPQ